MAFNKEAFYKIKSELAGRDVRILVATKYAAVSDINVAIECRVDLIGENKVQSAIDKFGSIGDCGALGGCEKRFIGHLQSNKVRKAVEIFDMIESVDSVALAGMVNLEAFRVGVVMPILLQVNVANDVKKFGFKLDEVEMALLQIVELKNIKIRGFMAMMPNFENKEQLRIFFKKMKEIFEKYKDEYGLDILSMGMSEDYKIAVEEGATEVRLGSILFG